MAEFAADIKELGDKIAALTVAKAVELGTYLEETYKIKPAAGAAPAAPTNVAPVAVKVEQTEFTPVLEAGFDSTKKIGIIKVVREITQLGLKEAKDLVEGAPKAVKENIAKEDAEKIKKSLEDAGAKVTIK